MAKLCDSAREASIISSSILRSLPLPAEPTSDGTLVWSLVSQSLILAYESADPDVIELATANLDVLAQLLPSASIKYLEVVSAALTLWISDTERLLTEEEYDVVIPAVYAAILEVISTEPSVDTLTTYCTLLVCVTDRITPTLSTIKSFKEFWINNYATKVDPEQIPKELCPLLLAMDESIQEMEDEPHVVKSVEESTVHSYEADDTVDNDSQSVPPSTDSSLAGDSSDTCSETDSLSTIVPLSEVPECGEEDVSPPASPWTGSFEITSTRVEDNDDDDEEEDDSDENDAKEQAPVFKVSRIALSQIQNPITPSRRSQFKNSTVSSLSKTASFTFFGAVMGSSSSGSKSRKRRSLDDQGLSGYFNSFV